MTLSRWSAPRLGLSFHEDERAVGWLELFYDLIFVAALIQLGTAFGNDLTWSGAGRFAVLFAFLWWSWTGTTFYMNRIAVDDLTQRLLMVVQMYAVGTVAVVAADVFDGGDITFAIAYAGIRLTIAAMYARAYRLVPEARELARWYAASITIGAALWLISTAVPAPGRYVLWGAALAVDVSWALSSRMRHVTARVLPPRSEHMIERFALLTLIVLGESFIKTISSVASKGASTDTQIMFILGLAIAAGLWWTYFDDIADSPINPSTSPLPVSVWIYGHLPLTMALTAAGVGIQKLVTTDLDDSLADYEAVLLIGSLCVVLLSVAMLDLVTRNRHFGVTERERLVPRLVAVVALIVVGFVGGSWPAWIIGTTIAAVVVAQIAVEIVVARQADREMAERVASQVDPARDTCDHLLQLGDAGPTSAGCLACIEENMVWVHLRLCTSCGHVGCCDESPGRHARLHAGDSEHPTVRSLEPDELWAWCYPDEAAAATEAHPVS